MKKVLQQKKSFFFFLWGGGRQGGPTGTVRAVIPSAFSEFLPPNSRRRRAAAASFLENQGPRILGNFLPGCSRISCGKRITVKIRPIPAKRKKIIVLNPFFLHVSPPLLTPLGFRLRKGPFRAFCSVPHCCSLAGSGYPVGSKLRLQPARRAGFVNGKQAPGPTATKAKKSWGKKGPTNRSTMDRTKRAPLEVNIHT